MFFCFGNICRLCEKEKQYTHGRPASETCFCPSHSPRMNHRYSACDREGEDLSRDVSEPPRQTEGSSGLRSPPQGTQTSGTHSSGRLGPSGSYSSGVTQTTDGALVAKRPRCRGIIPPACICNPPLGRTEMPPGFRFYSLMQLESFKFKTHHEYENMCIQF